MEFLSDDFLLHSPTARRLFHEVAREQPIIDYHCHLDPKEIAEDKRWENIADVWLGGDHYKWRLMRANGIDEGRITGDAPPLDKFQAWAETVPMTLRNPIYQWTHLELRRCFGIDTLLTQESAMDVWNAANARMAEDSFSARGLMSQFNVEVVCTTDDPAEPLDWHAKIAASDCATRVYPTFRPDKAMRVDDPGMFNEWCDKLAAQADIDVAHFSDLLDALQRRHDAFHAIGCRISDHGLEVCPNAPCSDGDARETFERARLGVPATPEQTEQFATYMMLYFGRLDAAKGWTKQLHLGAVRNVNTRIFKHLGPDCGGDTIGDWPQTASLLKYLDTLDAENSLPKIIVYNLNPADNYAFATAVGSFQGDGIPGKIQFGSGWWFLDQKQGMEWQLDALSATGLLSRFVGMLTDSRSFLSYPRHEYFRRILCNIIGSEADRGELPGDFDILSALVRGICYENARDLLAFPRYE
jgi:glucuronate isomerase